MRLMLHRHFAAAGKCPAGGQGRGLSDWSERVETNGGTNNEALEKIDFAPALKTAGRLKDDSRLSSGTLATD